jgi:hypothetical protein
LCAKVNSAVVTNNRSCNVSDACFIRSTAAALHVEASEHASQTYLHVLCVLSPGSAACNHHGTCVLCHNILSSVNSGGNLILGLVRTVAARYQIPYMYMSKLCKANSCDQSCSQC